MLPPRQAFPLARLAAERAVALDPSLAEPWAALGNIHFLADDQAGAERDFAAALARNPSYAAGYYWQALFLMAAGRQPAAFASIAAATALDPFSFAAGIGLGTLHYLARQPQAAAARAAALLELEPRLASAHLLLGLALEQRGACEQAAASLRRAARLAPAEPAYLGALGHCWAAQGQRERARAVLAQLVNLGLRRYVGRYEIALIHVGLSRADAAAIPSALRWLRAAAREGCPMMVFAPLAPRFDHLRDHPGFPRIG